MTQRAEASRSEDEQVELESLGRELVGRVALGERPLRIDIVGNLAEPLLDLLAEAVRIGPRARAAASSGSVPRR